MKARFEQVQAEGQSPEQIQELATAYAGEVIRRQIPRFIYQTRSWWVGFRRFLIVSLLAFGLATGLA
jgi:cytochrome c-type biogenesis protein CcmH/NrfF